MINKYFLMKNIQIIIDLKHNLIKKKLLIINNIKQIDNKI